MDLARIQIHADHPHEVVVAVAGEVDLAKHQEFLGALETAVKKAGVDVPKRVVVDLSQTTFLDSGGIRALIDGRQAADGAGVEFVVTGVSGMVHTVLEVTGVLTFLAQDSGKG